MKHIDQWQDIDNDVISVDVGHLIVTVKITDVTQKTQTIDVYKEDGPRLIAALQKACGVPEPVSEKLGITPADDRIRELTERMQLAEDHDAGLRRRLDVVEARLDHVSHNVIGEIINALVNR